MKIISFFLEKKMLKIKDLKNEEYEWIKKSDFYMNLDLENEEDEINFSICSKLTNDINIFIETANFLISNYLPEEFYRLFFSSHDILNILDHNEENSFYTYLKDIYLLNTPVELLNYAAKNGRMDILKYMDSGFFIFKCLNTEPPKSIKCQQETTSRLAAGNGHLDCLIYLHEREPISQATCHDGCPSSCVCDACTVSVAAINGHLDCLIYLYENGCIFNISGATRYASEGGHLNCLKYLNKISLEKGKPCPWNPFCCEISARGGHLSCLIFLHENGCSWNCRSTEHASEKGRIECLKYLHKNGCPWNSRCIEYASEKGNIECLIYLHENGCPWNEMATLKAFNKGQIECFKYLILNGCPCHKDIFSTKEKLLKKIEQVKKETECLEFLMKDI